MLGRGHLSMWRQGHHGSWPDREDSVSTPDEGRHDVVPMDGQLERENLLQFCPKSRPQKYFSPPRRPWDFTKVSQPKRLWDFSPPLCKEVLQVNTLSSTGRIRDPREQYCGSFDGMRSMGGFSNHLPPAHRCVRFTEDTTRRSQSASRSHMDQANVRQGFWSGKDVASSVEPAQKQDHDLQLTIHQKINSFSKAVAEQQSKALQLTTKLEVDIQEIGKLKAQMVLLCEKLACYMSRWSKNEGKAGMANALDSEQCLLLKGIGELKRVVSEATADADSLSKQGKEIKEFETECAVVEEFEEVCRCRAHAWKMGLGTLSQVVLWYTGLVMTIFRFTNPGLYLTPT